MSAGLAMSEQQLYDVVVGSDANPGLARIYHWRVAHFRAAMTNQGWRTPVAADGKGFPDLIMIRGDDLLAIELKTDVGYVTTAQRLWLDAFAPIALLAAVWRPAQWADGTILRTLSGSGETRIEQ